MTEGPPRKLAVVLFNLGGPDGPDSVKPFLNNLFRDPAIIGLPAVLRLPLAKLISSRREAEAKANYAVMGGGSPLLPETQKQAAALSALLAERLPDQDVRVFIAMRYWKPFTEETARIVAAWSPDAVVLLPLYPQFSTTTTGSSLKAWRAAFAGDAPVHAVCCYPDAAAVVEAHARRIEQTFDAAGRPPNLRLLFSAHGLPETLVARGDPYQWQIERTAAAVAARLGAAWDWSICYQSRVGPMKWLGPSTPEAIAQAAADGRGVLISPIAFVSEHVETLVELDRDYADLAGRLGVRPYLRAPALGIETPFIEQLVELVVARAGPRSAGIQTAGLQACPADFGRCPLRQAA